jgi:hypothetical protein
MWRRGRIAGEDLVAARYAEVTETGRKWRDRAVPPPAPVELECAGGGPALPVRLIDLSTYGCRVGGAGVDDVGDHVRLSFGGRPQVTATVVWRQDGAIGCRFDKPIATSLMRAVICGEG